MPGRVPFVVLHRDDDPDARAFAHRDVPDPAPAATMADKGHWRIGPDILERIDHAIRPDVIGVDEIAPDRDQPEIVVEPAAAVWRAARQDWPVASIMKRQAIRWLTGPPSVAIATSVTPDTFCLNLSARTPSKTLTPDFLEFSSNK